MDRSQSLNTPPYFDGSNYAFWKVHMHTFLCAIDELVWDSIENGWVRPTIAKSEQDKVAFALANANSKVINPIFYGVSTNEFHRILHVKTSKEVQTILVTTYEGTKKVKDTKLQMLTTQFEEVKMNDDESFDSFYRRVNKIVIAKLNLKKKIEDAKDLYKIKIAKVSRLRSPPLRRVKIWTRSRFKSLLALFKPMNSNDPLTSPTNHLLLKP